METVARYGDTETMRILTVAEHLRARTDKSYLLARYAKIVEERMDTSVKLVTAFDDLVSVMRSVAEVSRGVERRIESGLMGAYEALETSDDSSDSGFLVFEDAQGCLAPNSKSWPSPCPLGTFEKRTAT